MADDPIDLRLRALASAPRRDLLAALADGERGVGELADAADLSQPATSQHLRVLRDAGVVQVRAEGNRRLYAIDGSALDEVRQVLDRFWAGRLDALARRAEALTAEPPSSEATG